MDAGGLVPLDGLVSQRPTARASATAALVARLTPVATMVAPAVFASGPAWGTVGSGRSGAGINSPWTMGWMASTGQTFAQAPQPVHVSSFTWA